MQDIEWAQQWGHAVGLKAWFVIGPGKKVKKQLKFKKRTRYDQRLKLNLANMP